MHVLLRIMFPLCVGDVLHAAWQSSQLSTLDVSQSGVTGTLPLEWASMAADNRLATSLRQLYLHQTNITGQVPSSWSNFKWVTHFTLWGTSVCERHPELTSQVQLPAGLGSLCLDTTLTRIGKYEMSGQKQTKYVAKGMWREGTVGVSGMQRHQGQSVGQSVGGCSTIGYSCLSKKQSFMQLQVC